MFGIIAEHTGMKRALIIILLHFFLLFSFSACYNYEEGGSFSLLSPEKRLEGTWQYWNVTDLRNNTVHYAGYENWRITFYKDYRFTKNVEYLNDENLIQIVDIEGTWELAGDHILIINEEGIDIRYFTIKRLKSSELWIEDFYERIQFNKL